MTGGCPDKHGKVACNRPYSNSRPSEEIRNFPFIPEKSDIELIKKGLTRSHIVEKLWMYWIIAGLFFMMIEIFTPGFLTLLIGIACMITAIFAWMKVSI